MSVASRQIRLAISDQCSNPVNSDTFLCSTLDFLAPFLNVLMFASLAYVAYLLLFKFRGEIIIEIKRWIDGHIAWLWRGK